MTLLNNTVSTVLFCVISPILGFGCADLSTIDETSANAEGDDFVIKSELETECKTWRDTSMSSYNSERDIQKRSGIESAYMIGYDIDEPIERRFSSFYSTSRDQLLERMDWQPLTDRPGCLYSDYYYLDAKSIKEEYHHSFAGVRDVQCPNAISHTTNPLREIYLYLDIDDMANGDSKPADRIYMDTDADLRIDHAKHLSHPDTDRYRFGEHLLGEAVDSDSRDDTDGYVDSHVYETDYTLRIGAHELENYSHLRNDAECRVKVEVTKEFSSNSSTYTHVESKFELLGPLQCNFLAKNDETAREILIDFDSKCVR